MSGIRRQLPPFPNPDNLRKQAKTRLAELRAQSASTRLAEAQHLVAREYGFANWTALQAEVARRLESLAGHYVRSRRQPVKAPRPRDIGDAPQTPAPMLVVTASAAIFAVMAGTGVGMIFLLSSMPPGHFSRLHDAVALLHKFL